MTEDQLRLLLEACPNFDEEAELAAHEILQKLESDPDYDTASAAATVPVPPQIGFDLPGFDGRPVDYDSATIPPDMAQIEHVLRLVDVLTEKASDFYAQQGW
jgi:hypothetical protein